MYPIDARTDEVLLPLLAEGDHAAFTVLYNRYWAKLLAIAYNHTRDKSAAEEIVQDLFVGLWNRRGQLHIENLANYLATATKFAVFKHYYRKQKREASLIGKLSVIEEERIDEVISAKFLQEYIDGLVEKLPEKCRLVFKMSREQHRNNAEIAEELGVSEKTVEMHITKAIKTIRKELDFSGVIAVLVAHEIFK